MASTVSDMIQRDEKSDQDGDYGRGADSPRSQHDRPCTAQLSSKHEEEDVDKPAGVYKIFIGGLHRDTQSDEMRDYFSKFGRIVEGAVVCDKDSGRSRGFGFCTFQTKEVMETVLDSSHHLGGNDLRVALPKEASRSNDGMINQPGRIFVGGISESVTQDSFADYFSQFGKLSAVKLMTDKESHRPRGYGFVTYDDPVDAPKAMGNHSNLGRGCEAKKAQPRPNRNSRRSPVGSRRPARRNSGRYDDQYRSGGYGYGGGYYPSPYMYGQGGDMGYGQHHIYPGYGMGPYGDPGSDGGHYSGKDSANSHGESSYRNRQSTRFARRANPY